MKQLAYVTLNSVRKDTHKIQNPFILKATTNMQLMVKYYSPEDEE